MVRRLTNIDYTATMTATSAPPRSLRWLILVGAAALLLGLGQLPEVRGFVLRAYAAMTSHNPDVTRAFVQSLGWGGPLALLVAYVVQAVLPVVPSLALTVVTVRAYGLLEGFVIVYSGALLGSAAGYGLGRALGDPLVHALAGERARNSAYAFAHKNGLQGVLLVRLVPLIPAEAMSLVAGAVHMGFRPFMLATALGVLPVTLLVVWLSGDLHRLATGLAVLSLVAIAGAAGRWLWQRRQRTIVARQTNS